MKKTKSDDIAFLIVFVCFGVAILLMAIFELTILGIAFFGADKVECNFLWCTFTTENNFINDSIVIRANQVCHYNGEKLPCNDSRFKNIPIVDTLGNFD